MKQLLTIILILLSKTYPQPALADESVQEENSVAQTPELDAMTQHPPIGETKKKIRKALANLKYEPPLAELQKAALRLADADPESTATWMRAPNVSAILPTLKFTADYDIGRDEALDRYQDDPDRWGADTDRKYGFQLSAQWEFDKIIFNPDEVRVYSALADRASRRENLLAVLVSYYFERRKLQITNLINPPADPTEGFVMGLRIEELTASIDALTGGLLSRKLKANQ